MTETDFYGDYARGARMVQQGRIVPARYGVVGPVYEVTLALAGFIVRDLFLAAQLLSVAAMTGALLAWFFLLRRRVGARVALLGTLFTATNAHFFHYGYAATTDALALALQAGAFYLLLASRGPRAMPGAGLLAGAFSMAAGAYVATSSQEEVARTERRKNAFLSRQPPTAAAGDESALGSAIAVGVSYLAGAVVPVLPVALGAKTILAPAIVGGAITVVVSLVLAFLSGMEVRRRVLTNLAIIASAVVVTYLSGLVLSAAFGISP